ncbi:MAG: ATP-binding protein [Nannocystaceae bacterium]
MRPVHRAHATRSQQLYRVKATHQGRWQWSLQCRPGGRDGHVLTPTSDSGRTPPWMGSKVSSLRRRQRVFALRRSALPLVETPWEGRHVLIVWIVVATVVATLVAWLLATTRRARRHCECLATALSGLPGYVGIVDRHGVILWVNRAWEVLEASHPLAKLVVGERWFDHRPFGRELAERVELVTSGKLRHHREEVVVGVDAEQFLELRLRRLDRPVGGAVVSFADVGKRQRAEQEALRARAALTHMDRVAVLAELTSTIAHELNQPLTAIHVNARVAQKVLARTPPDIAEGLAALADVGADSERARAVIGRLRTLLQRGEGRASVADLRALARDATALTQREALVRQVSLVLDLDGEPLPVLVDPVQIQQIVLNLLSNAFDAVGARPHGKRCVELSAQALESGVAELAVRDSGTGIEPELQERLFEPFFTTKASGLGLGLAICRTIAEAHHGLLVAESSATGSTLRLRLPLHRPG